jgi:hypothetical protein
LKINWWFKVVFPPSPMGANSSRGQRRPRRVWLLGGKNNASTTAFQDQLGLQAFPILDAGPSMGVPSAAMMNLHPVLMHSPATGTIWEIWPTTEASIKIVMPSKMKEADALVYVMPRECTEALLNTHKVQLACMLDIPQPRPLLICVDDRRPTEAAGTPLIEWSTASLVEMLGLSGHSSPGMQLQGAGSHEAGVKEGTLRAGRPCLWRIQPTSATRPQDLELGIRWLSEAVGGRSWGARRPPSSLNQLASVQLAAPHKSTSLPVDAGGPDNAAPAKKLTALEVAARAGSARAIAKLEAHNAGGHRVDSLKISPGTPVTGLPPPVPAGKNEAASKAMAPPRPPGELGVHPEGVELRVAATEDVAATVDTVTTSDAAAAPTPQPCLASLDADVLRLVCAHLDGRGLVALAKAAHRSQHALRAATRNEVWRRECSVTTTIAKADSAGTAVIDVAKVLLKQGVARRLQGAKERELTGSDSTRALTLHEFIRINQILGTAAASASVPLSDLIDGTLRRSGVSIIGADHQPPPAPHVEQLVVQCLECAQLRQQHLLSIPQQCIPPTHVKELIGWCYWRLTWIHPFVDGNGRTAHLAALFVALRAVGDEALPARSSWRTLLCQTGHVHSLAECLTFLEYRRLECRRELVEALRATDTAWAALSRDERQRLMAVPSSSEDASRAPWTEVGRILVSEIWKEVGTRLAQVTTRKKERKLVYRWTNDLGGGDYSTGITDSAGGGATPTWIETAQGPRRWREMDERLLQPTD